MSGVRPTPPVLRYVGLLILPRDIKVSAILPIRSRIDPAFGYWEVMTVSNHPLMPQHSPSLTSDERAGSGRPLALMTRAREFALGNSRILDPAVPTWRTRLRGRLRIVASGT